MSKQLKEVIYLNDADRPKKQEPLSFTEWYKNNDKYLTQFVHLSSARINDATNEYADYRNSFNAEVKEVEFTGVLCGDKGWTVFESEDLWDISKSDKIVYIGNCKTDGDLFNIYVNGRIEFFKGHLNSGFYSVEL